VVSGFDIKIDTIIGSNIYIRTQTIIKDKSSNYISQYYDGVVPGDCEEVFEDTESYFLWLGGIESLTWNWPSLDCETECGLTEPGLTGAIEEVQYHINVNYPNPTCPSGRVWNGGYTDIHMEIAHIDWFEGYFEWCGISAEKTYYGCDCLSADELNCIFCTIYNEIATPEYPITIPSGYELVGVELGVDFSFTTPIEDSVNRIDIVYYYGKKICANSKILYTGDILIMHLEYLECC
jgi:hypothetical protein